MRTRPLYLSAFVVLLAITLFFSACAPQYVCPDGTTAGDASKCPVQKKEVAVEKKAAEAPALTPVIAPLEAEIKALADKGKQIDSLEYDLDLGTPEAVKIYWKGNYIKKAPYTLPSIFSAGRYYHEIYIDRSNKTAYAACTDPAKCPKEQLNTAYSVDFAQENIATPLDLLALLESYQDVKKKGTVVVQKRNALLVAYTNEQGQREELTIDTFYGIPLEQKFLDADEEVVEAHSFTLLRVGKLKDGEVMMGGEVKVSG